MCFYERSLKSTTNLLGSEAMHLYMYFTINATLESGEKYIKNKQIPVGQKLLRKQACSICFGWCCEKKKILSAKLTAFWSR